MVRRLRRGPLAVRQPARRDQPRRHPPRTHHRPPRVRDARLDRHDRRRHRRVRRRARPPVGRGRTLGTWGDALGNGTRYLLITPIYCFTGALIGAAALRFAGRAWFTLVVLVAAAGQYSGVLALEFGYARGGTDLAGWAGICLAVTAVLVAGLAATLRTVPVRTK
nr:hypothetical protein GCM10025732_45910 [Glycomyces mayteni]